MPAPLAAAVVPAILATAGTLFSGMYAAAQEPPEAAEGKSAMPTASVGSTKQNAPNQSLSFNKPKIGSPVTQNSFAMNQLKNMKT